MQMCTGITADGISMETMCAMSLAFEFPKKKNFLLDLLLILILTIILSLNVFYLEKNI